MDNKDSFVDECNFQRECKFKCNVYIMCANGCMFGTLVGIYVGLN